MQKFGKERVARMLNVMREGLRLDYEGKGLLSFVSNERGSHGGESRQRRIGRKESVDERQAN